MSEEFVTSRDEENNESSNLPSYDDVKNTIDDFKGDKSGDSEKSPDNSDSSNNDAKTGNNEEKSTNGGESHGGKAQNGQSSQGGNSPQNAQGGNNPTSSPMGGKAQKEAASKAAKNQVGNASMESSAAGSGLGGAQGANAAMNGAASKGTGKAAEKAGEEVAKKVAEQTAKEATKAAAKTAAKTAAKSNPYSGIVVVALEVLKKVWDATRSNDNNLWLFIVGIMAIFSVIITVVLNAPSLIYNYAVNETEYVVGNTYHNVTEKYTAKGKFFSDMFEDLGYGNMSGSQIYNVINSQGGVDVNNAVIYRKIIDHAIEKSFTTNIKAVLAAPSQIIKGMATSNENEGGWIHGVAPELFGEIGSFFTGYNFAAQYEAYLNEVYPYSSAKSGTTFYTIGECVNKEIPDNKLNDQVNYEEILSVLSQSESFQYENISYSEFYDLMLEPSTQLLLVEIYFGKDHIWYYNDGDSMQTFRASDYGGNMKAMEAAYKAMLKDWKQMIEDTPKKLLSEIVESFDGENEEDEDEGDKDDEDKGDDKYESESSWEKRLQSIFKGRVGFYYDVKIAPYGLSELYYIFDAEPFDDYVKNNDFSNLEMLDWQELLSYQYIGKSVNMGPTYLDVRKADSPAYQYYIDQGIEPTYRSLTYYLPERLGKDITGEAWMFQDCDIEFAVVDSCFIPEGYSVQINIDYVINQGAFGGYNRGSEPSGETGRMYTIAQAGCIDCAFASVVGYLSKNTSTLPEIEMNGDWLVNQVCGLYVHKQAFDAWSFCRDNGCTFSTVNKGTNFKETVANAIDQGYPVIICIDGYWPGYHLTTSTHWITIYGYDDSGIYIANPDGGVKKKIPDSAWNMCPITCVDIVSPIDKDNYIPNMTIIEP